MPAEHLAFDPELLERYVLDRVSAEERLAIGRHLRLCAQCRRAVQEERVLAAGVRRSGREELKKKIGAHPVRFSPSWQQVLSAAAVLLVLVAAGIYEEWLAPRTPEPVQAPLAQSQPRESTPSTGLQPPRTEHPAAKAEEKSEVGRQEVGIAKDIRTESHLKEGIAASNAPAAPEAQAAGAPAELNATKPVPSSGGTVVGGMLKTSETYWTTGTVLPQSRESLSAPESGNVIARKAARAADRLTGADQEAYTKRADLLGKRDSAAGTAPEVTLNQRPSSSLPAERRQLQTQAGANTVQTLVNQRDDHLTMTLYLDSLVNDADLRKAKVQQVSADSLVVNMANEKIGYRLQQQVQLKGQKPKK